MKTNVLLVLDTRVKRKDGTFPLILRVVHFRASSQIPLSLYLHPADWDEKKRIIKPSYKGTESTTRLNNYIQKKKVEAMDIITKLDEAKQLNNLTVAQIKELIEKKSDNLSFFQYTEKLIEEMIKVGRIGNARSYKSTLVALKTFRKDKDLSFNEVNYAFLLKLEADHLSKGNSVNGLAVRMRTIKAIYNRAIKAGIVDREQYPFTHYRIKSKKTRKRAISSEALGKIEALKFKIGDPLYHTHNYFLFCFYLRGLPFADMASLKVSNIVNGRIQYSRQKTEKPYDVKLADNAQRILNSYTAGKGKDDYIFPIIKRAAPADIYKDIEWARSRYNKKLKQIAALCGIEENLTSYVGRHSFATIAKSLNIPVSAISDMLGHSSIRTTEIYMDSLPDAIQDDFHEQILTNASKKSGNIKRRSS